MKCSNCGNALADDAKFCPSCGSPVPAQAATMPQTPAAASPPPEQPAPPSPAVATSAPAAPVAAAQGDPGSSPRATTAPSINLSGLASLQPLQWVAIAGLAIAVVATFFPWVSVSGFGQSETASAWNGDLGGDLQIGHWLGAPDSFPVEALVIIAIAVAGIWLTAGAAVGLKVPDVRYVAIVLGVVLVVIGALNYLYIEDQLESVGVDEIEGISAGPSTGVYLVVVGGLVTAAAGYLMEQARLRAAR
jgi:hypothetical protein